MDEALVAKTYRTILFSWALAMVWAVVYGQTLIGVNVTIGVAMASALLFSLDVIVRRVFVPGSTKPKPKLVVFALARYAGIAIILYWLVRWTHFNLLAFCGGILLVHFALLAKLAGIKLVEQRAKQEISAEKKPMDRSKES